jgi:hypothetical protein
MNGGRLHQEQGAASKLAAEGSRDKAISHSPARSRSGAWEAEQLQAEDQEFEITMGRRAAAEGEEVNQQAKEGIGRASSTGQQIRRAGGANQAAGWSPTP